MIENVRRLDLDTAADHVDDDPGVEGNRRLTATLGVVLLVLLAIEGGTIPFLSGLEPVHVIVGLILIPVVLLKLASTFYRFTAYYLSKPAYKRAGPPHPILRVDGPFVIVLTVVLFASGVALAASGHHNNTLYAIHKLSFIAWFGAMTVHVLGHLMSLPAVARRDWTRGARIPGSRARQLAVASVLAVGVAASIVIYPLLPAWGHG